MIDLNYQTNFTFPTCKGNPEVVIMDGITLGTLKHIPETPRLIDEFQKFSIIPTSNRVFIPSAKTRKMLKEFSFMGLRERNFDEMLTCIAVEEFVNHILYSTVECNGWIKINGTYPGVNAA